LIVQILLVINSSMVTKLNLFLDNGSIFDIDLIEHRLHSTVVKWFKHLGHVDIPWNKWNYTHWSASISHESLIDNMIGTALNLDMILDPDKLLDQKYLNALHAIFEKTYDGRAEWLEYNAMIHALEKYTGSESNKPWHEVLEVNYGNLAGPLKIKFQYEWLGMAALKIPKGTVYLAWDEKGKNPWSYYYDKEHTDLDRFLEICRPWVWLTTKTHIALEDIDFTVSPDTGWEQWYAKKHSAFCRHYGLPEWTVNDMMAVIPIGTVGDPDQLKSLIKNQNYPTRIKLG